MTSAVSTVMAVAMSVWSTVASAVWVVGLVLYSGTSAGLVSATVVRVTVTYHVIGELASHAAILGEESTMEPLITMSALIPAVTTAPKITVHVALPGVGPWGGLPPLVTPAGVVLGSSTVSASLSGFLA